MSTPTERDDALTALSATDSRSGGDSGAARQSSLREHNLAVTCQTVFASAPISRARLAAATGLTRSTVSRLVEELVQAGIVVEHDARGAGRPGRPAVPLAPAKGTIVGLGLQVNVDYMAGRVMDLTGAVVAEEYVAGDFESSDPVTVLRAAGDLTRDLVARATATGARVARACLGLPGLVETRSRRLLLAPNLGWHELAPADLMGPGLLPPGADLLVDNDANLAAYGIAHAAPGRVAESGTFLYVAGDIGVGAAIVVNGRVIRGQHGWAGEIGHVSIEPNGPQCHCGARGCLERYAGKHAVLEAAGLPTTAAPADLAAAAAAGYGAPRVAVERAAWALGIALSGTVNVVDVGEIVLGAGFIPLIDQLRPGVEEQLRVRTLAGPWSSTVLRVAPPDPAPAATGGAMRALEWVAREPAAWIDALAVEA
ncbi:putative NBD/HSP70 family sugar kinase [Georgenia soli]|uniref:Putative NBD/HSP70 family sugar kinase n=1 Tax=Georgenia soli TaxID=638953 RepID=A0A2A9EML0_9MICO|nr:ROK family transcriptional regulator [Georgenia soli]PFG40327.1 putative NBD/HSP70 family sugar kinase [Georgenia soli]